MIDASARQSGLVAVGHALIEGIENKRNRNGRIERAVEELEKSVKEKPGHFTSSKGILAYKSAFDSQKSALGATEPGPKILSEIIIKNGHLPKISRVVDCMNLVSVESGLTVSAWDADGIRGGVVYKLSDGGEKYWPFMGEEIPLVPGELAAFDEEKVLCLVRYRDSKYAPVTADSKRIAVHIQGVNGIGKPEIEKALNELEQLVLENCGGTSLEKKIID